MFVFSNYSVTSHKCTLYVGAADHCQLLSRVSRSGRATLGQRPLGITSSSHEQATNHHTPALLRDPRLGACCHDWTKPRQFPALGEELSVSACERKQTQYLMTKRMVLFIEYFLLSVLLAQTVLYFLAPIVLWGRTGPGHHVVK